jgi:hypothetical protein
MFARVLSHNTMANRCRTGILLSVASLCGVLLLIVLSTQPGRLQRLTPYGGWRNASSQDDGKEILTGGWPSDVARNKTLGFQNIFYINLDECAPVLLSHGPPCLPGSATQTNRQA